MGRHLLNDHQMERMRLFHQKWGVVAIFLTRFLPGLRAMVPASAGVSRIAWWRVAVPVAIASAIWYGALVWLGSTAGSHLDEIKAWIDQAKCRVVDDRAGRVLLRRTLVVAEPTVWPRVTVLSLLPRW